MRPSSLKSKLSFLQKLPTTQHFESQTLVIYDRALLAVSPEFKIWLTKMPASYGVSGGESLKDIAAFPRHIERILRATQEFSPSKMRIVTVGGGSVGDFGGFVASVLKRGVRLSHVPSTWLAALDSAHGGKTALNVKSMKNQVGTYYPADEIFLVRSLLLTQPNVRAEEAFGELAKIAFIDGRKWSHALLKNRQQTHPLLWKFLKPAIEAKYRIVEKDPFETKGIRQLLNLGHTFGHALEAARGVAHGEAVAQGLYFALKWSLQKGIIPLKEYFNCVQLLNTRLQIPCWLEQERHFEPIRLRTLQTLLLHDKKRSSRDQIQFIFLRKWGRPIIQRVAIADVLKEARRQGWTK